MHEIKQIWMLKGKKKWAKYRQISKGLLQTSVWLKRFSAQIPICCSAILCTILFLTLLALSCFWYSSLFRKQITFLGRKEKGNMVFPAMMACFYFLLRKRNILTRWNLRICELFPLNGNLWICQNSCHPPRVHIFQEMFNNFCLGKIHLV